MMNDMHLNPNDPIPLIPDDAQDIPSLLKRYGLRYKDGAERLTIEPDDFELGDDEFQAHMLRLLNETLIYASWAMITAAYNYNGDRLTQHLDDQGDYSRAISDQITWCTDTTTANDGTDIAERILALINYTRDEVDNYPEGDTNAMGFQYGYADHFTPLSALCFMNTDDED